MCWHKLDQVAQKFVKAGKMPNGYNYPELCKCDKMPRELAEALKRKIEHELRKQQRL